MMSDSRLPTSSDEAQYRKAAAPDAMREALRGAQHHIDAVLKCGNAHKLALAVQGRALLKDIDAALSAPVPPPDGAGETEIRWQRVNNDPFEYAIQQGPHGDEFVKLLNGSCLRRAISTSDAGAAEPDDVRSALADKIRYLHARKNLGPLYGDSMVTDEECALIVDALRSAPVSADALAGLDERLDRLCLTALNGSRFILSTESAQNIAGIVREWLRVKSSASPPVRGDREAIGSLKQIEAWLSRAKYDAIAAQLSVAIAALSAPDATVSEPVAWRWKPLGGNWQYAESDARFPDGAGTLQPLYTSPQDVGREATVSASDPDVIIAGIKQFGLAADGSDLRDLLRAVARIRHEAVSARDTVIEECALTGAVCCDAHHQPKLGTEVSRAIRSLAQGASNG